MTFSIPTMAKPSRACRAVGIFLDEILGVEVIAKKKVSDVPNMGRDR